MKNRKTNTPSSKFLILDMMPCPNIVDRPLVLFEFDTLQEAAEKVANIIHRHTEGVTYFRRKALIEVLGIRFVVVPASDVCTETDEGYKTRINSTYYRATVTDALEDEVIYCRLPQSS